MAIISDPTEEHLYILESERELEEHQQTKWYYRTPTGREMAKIQKTAGFDGKDSSTASLVLAEAVRLCLVRWENLLDRKGQEMPFSPEARDRLSYPVMAELGGEILNSAELSMGGAKNC